MTQNAASLRWRPFDANGAFQPIAHDGFERRAVRSAGVNVLSQGLVFAVQIVSTLILARLLTPEDFGLVTMVTTFSILLMNFGLNGFTEAVIQREGIDDALASNLFWVCLGGGALLTAGLAAAGSLLARFFSDQRVGGVAVFMSLTVFFGATSVVHIALLKRALRFTETSVNDIVSGVVGFAVMIALALAGKGYWALVAGAVARPLTLTAGAWYLCRWMPRPPGRAPGTASVLRFAMNVYGRFCLNYGTRNTDNLLVGWRLGPHLLGSYKKAYDLFVLPACQILNPIQDVALSALSRVAPGGAQYRRYILDGLSLLAFVGMGVGAILTITATDLIYCLLGPGWESAGQIFAFFGPGIGIMLIYNCIGLIHLTIGRADRWVRWVVVEFLVTAVLFVLGLHWGGRGVAGAWTLSFWLLTIPAYWYAGQPIKLGFKPVVAVVWKFALASLLAGYASAALLREIQALVGASGTLGAIARILVITPVFIVSYLGAVVILHNGTWPLKRVARLLPDIIPRWNAVVRENAKAPSSVVP